MKWFIQWTIQNYEDRIDYYKKQIVKCKSLIKKNKARLRKLK